MTKKSFVAIGCLTILTLLAIAGFNFWRREQIMPQVQTSPQTSAKRFPAPSPEQVGKSMSPLISNNNATTTLSPFESSSPADWKTYRNEEYGFEVRYPASFEIEGDPSDLVFTIFPKNPNPLEVISSPLILEVILPVFTFGLRLEDFVEKVIEHSSRLDTFHLFQQSKLSFSGREAYKIAFTGGIDYNQINGSYLFFEEPMEAIYIDHSPYIIVIFIPKSSNLFSIIASTLTLFNPLRR